MPHPVDIAVGNRVRELRTRAGLSQTELGVQLGVSFQQIQKYEKGTNRMGASRLIQVCEALSITITDIFDGIGNSKQATRKALVDPEVMRIAREVQAISDPQTRMALRTLVKSISGMTKSNNGEADQ